MILKMEFYQGLFVVTLGDILGIVENIIRENMFVSSQKNVVRIFVKKMGIFLAKFWSHLGLGPDLLFVINLRE